MKLKWTQAPVKTAWGHDMVVADLAIDKDHTVAVYCERDQAATKVEAMFSTPPAAPPVHHAVIAGALFDFMGWLTSRNERLVLSSADEVPPAVEAITEFAKMRGLSLDDARVMNWQSTPNRQWVGLTEWERNSFALERGAMSADWLVFMEAVERALKEKNA